MLALSKVIQHPVRSRHDQEYVHQALFLRAEMHVQAALATTSQVPGRHCRLGTDPVTHCQQAIEDSRRVIDFYLIERSRGIASADSSLLRPAFCILAEAASLGVPQMARRYAEDGLEHFPGEDRLLVIKARHEPATAVEKCLITLSPERTTKESRRLSLKSYRSDDEHEEEHIEDAFVCSICQRLFLDPITIPCGHTFCRGCLTSYLDYASARHHHEQQHERTTNIPTEGNLRLETNTVAACHCPLCRGPLHMHCRTHPGSVTVAAMIQATYPRALQRRQLEATEAMHGLKSSHNDVASGGTILLPLFVLGSIAPGMQLRLKIFEPRYRLMFRRVLEGNSIFGLAPCRSGTDTSVPGSWGTACKITESTTLADGQMIIVCEGLYRFRTGEVTQLDGYLVGCCTRYHDDPIEDPETLSLLEETLTPILAQLKVVAAVKKYGMEPIPDSLTFVGAENRSQAERQKIVETVSLILAGHIRCAGKYVRDTDTKARVANVVSDSRKWFPAQSNSSSKEAKDSACCIM